MAAFGGITTLDINPHGVVNASRLDLGTDLVEALESNLLLFFTGETRNATAILAHQDESTRNRESAVVNSLCEIKEIGLEIREAIVRGELRRFGDLLDVHWQSKKRLSNGITNPQIDAWYELARAHGALGGKISGAGGGGFLMLYCEERKADLRETMRRAGLRELHFRFDFEGSKVIFDIVTRDGRLAHLERQSQKERVLAHAMAGARN